MSSTRVVARRPADQAAATRALGFHLGWFVLLAAIGLCLYASAIRNPFLSDDVALLNDNAAIVHPTLEGLFGLWTIAYTQGLDQNGRVISLMDEDPNGQIRTVYRPVTTTTYWLNAILTGLTPEAFRLVNICLHALGAWLVGVWIAQLFGPFAGLVASLAIVVHPLATDVINRIVGRSDILMIVGVAGFLATQRTAERYGWTWGRTLVGALAATLGLGSKESAMIVLPLALVQAIVARSRTSLASTKAWRGAIAIGVPFAAYLVGRRMVLHWAPYAAVPQFDLYSNPVIGMSLVDRLPAVGALTIDYLRLLIWPRPLMGFDSPIALPTWADPVAWTGLVLFGGVGVSAIVLAGRRHPLAVAAGWFFFGFLIVGQVLTPIGAYREVRFAYELLGALGVVVGYLTVATFEGTPGYLRLVGVAVLSLVLLSAASLVSTRNRDFQSLRSLLEADLRYRPESAAAVSRLARLLDREGPAQQGRAEDLYRKAVTMAPWSAQAKEDLAEFLAARGRKAEAKRLWEDAVELKQSPSAMLRLGNMALDEGDFSTAQRYLTQAERLTPGSSWVAYNLAVLDDKRGDHAGAIRRLEELLARDPTFGPARAGLDQIK